MSTSTSNQEGVTGTGFALLPETTKKPDKICEKMVLRLWTLGKEGERSLRDGKHPGEP